MRRGMASAALSRAIRSSGCAQQLASPTLGATDVQVEEHVRYLRRSLEQWEAKQQLAKHIAYLRKSEQLAKEAELVSQHVAYLERGPKRREAILVAEHVAYLQSSAERAAAGERQSWLLDQVMSRLGRIESAIDNAQREMTAHHERMNEFMSTLRAAAGEGEALHPEVQVAWRPSKGAVGRNRLSPGRDREGTLRW